MTADCHCHALRDAGADHVADCRTPEVVENFPLYLGLFARGVPRLSNVSDGIAFVMEYVAGHADRFVRIFVFACGALLGDHVP
jgi:hypothetical protein